MSDTPRIGEKLAALRRANKIKRHEILAYLKESGMETTDQSLYRYEKGITDMPANVFLRICRFLNVEAPYLMMENTPEVEDVFSPALNDEGLRKVLEYERDLVATGKYVRDGAPRGDKNALPLFDLTSSVLVGKKLRSEKHFVSCTAKCESEPEFTVKLAGNSMLPVLHDGQVLYCVWAKEKFPENNTIGIFFYDGELHVKMYCGAITPRLISFNPAYPFIEIKKDLSFQFIGRVVGVSPY